MCDCRADVSALNLCFHEVYTCFLSSLMLLPSILQKCHRVPLPAVVLVNVEIKNPSVLLSSVLNIQILELQED